MELLREDAGDADPRRLPDGEKGLFPAPPGIGDKSPRLLWEEVDKVCGGCSENGVRSVL